MEDTGLLLVLGVLTAFVVGVLVEWLLGIFFLRRRMFTQVQDIQATLRAREAELTQSKTEPSESKPETNPLPADAETRTGARVELDNEMEMLQTRVAQLESDLATAASRASQLELELAAAALSKSSAEANLQASEKELGKRTAELEDHKRRQQNLVAENSSFAAGATTSAAALKRLESEKSFLQSQIDELQESLSAATGEKDTLEAKLGELKATLDTTASDKVNIEARNSELTEILNAAREEASGLQASLARQKDDLEAAIESKAALDQELGVVTAQLNAAISDRDYAFVVREGFEKEIRATKDRVSELEGELESATQGKATTEAELKELRAELQTSQSEASRLRAELDDHHAQKQRLAVDVKTTASASNIQELEGARIALQQQVKRLLVSLDTMANGRNALEQEVEELRAQLDAAKSELGGSAKAPTTHDSDAQAREQELVRLRSELNDTKSQVQKLRADAQKLTASATTSATVIKGLEGNKSNLQTKIDRLQANAEKSAGEKANLQKQIDKLRADLDAAANEKANLQAQMGQRQDSLGDLTNERDTLRREQDALKAKLDKAITDRKNALTIRIGKEKELEEVKAQLVELQGELDGALQSHETDRSNGQARDVETNKLRAELEIQRAQNKNLLVQIEKLKDDAVTVSAAMQSEESRKKRLTKSRRVTAEPSDGELETIQVSVPAVTGKKVQAAADLEEPIAQAPESVSDEPVFTPRVRDEKDETPFAAPCPQHLSDVKGIGSVFEQRLYEAGIGSYWQLSKLDDEDFKRILKLSELQERHMDFEAVRSDALQRALETRSLGRKWTCDKPDDFEPLPGIGSTFEKRLYDAGICTYAALAKTTVERLTEICHASARFKPDYATWIALAKERVEQKVEPKTA